MGADPILVLDVKCSFEKQDSEDMLSLDLVLPGGANINLKMAGHTLQAMCLLLNQLREHATWGVETAESAEDEEEGAKPSVH